MNRKKIIIISFLATITIVALIIAGNHRTQPSNIVYIKGLNECSKDLDSERLGAIGGDLYNYVALANTYNKIKSMPTYMANVIEGTCQKKMNAPVKGNDGSQVTVNTTTATVDIPGAKQSWLVTFDWVARDSNVIDVGSLEASCPTSTNVTFRTFHCKEVLSLQKYGTPNYDPILEYMPYSGEGFDLSYSPDSRTVVVSINIPSAQRGNQELIDNTEAIIPYWFQKRNLDINKYTVTYRVLYQ